MISFWLASKPWRGTTLFAVCSPARRICAMLSAAQGSVDHDNLWVPLPQSLAVRVFILISANEISGSRALCETVSDNERNFQGGLQAYQSSQSPVGTAVHDNPVDSFVFRYSTKPPLVSNTGESARAAGLVLLTPYSVGKKRLTLAWIAASMRTFWTEIDPNPIAEIKTSRPVSAFTSWS